MTTKRCLVLLVVLLGMSAVFFLPKHHFQPLGIELKLPVTVGDWTGEDLKITDEEIGILGPGTEFARKGYTNRRGDQLQVTIVLSGHDMNTSIHRPERCLVAQGWSLTASPSVAVAVPARGSLETKALKVIKMVNSDGRTIPYTNLNYYWFVGCADTTASHFQRWLIDKADRLFRGYNQRWAYFTVAATVTENLQRNGRSEAETAAMVEDFIKGLVPPTHLASVKFGS
ncbi:MAG: EpsI family protein [Verrucomicrobia bacterium]|nr:MAG: EpsI family protein [Verrucomicrobiota bacterium]